MNTHTHTHTLRNSYKKKQKSGQGKVSWKETGSSWAGMQLARKGPGATRADRDFFSDSPALHRELQTCHRCAFVGSGFSPYSIHLTACSINTNFSPSGHTHCQDLPLRACLVTYKSGCSEAAETEPLTAGAQRREGRLSSTLQQDGFTGGLAPETSLLSSLGSLEPPLGCDQQLQAEGLEDCAI